MSQWYAKTSGQVLSELDVNPSSGLSPRQAEERLGKYGPNRLEGAKKEPLAVRFLNQMKDPMIIVLLIAAVLSLASSGGEDWVEARKRRWRRCKRCPRPWPRWSAAGSTSAWRRTPWCLGTSSCWRRGTWCPPTPGFWSAPI